VLHSGTRKHKTHKTRLERFAKDKHPNLLLKFMNYRRKKFNNYRPRSEARALAVGHLNNHEFVGIMSYKVVPIDVMFRHEVEGAEGSDQRTEVNVIILFYSLLTLVQNKLVFCHCKYFSPLLNK
jgi:hypothetical protein